LFGNQSENQSIRNKLFINNSSSLQKATFSLLLSLFYFLDALDVTEAGRACSQGRFITCRKKNFDLLATIFKSRVV